MIDVVKPIINHPQFGFDIEYTPMTGMILNDPH